MNVNKTVVEEFTLECDLIPKNILGGGSEIRNSDNLPQNIKDASG